MLPTPLTTPAALHRAEAQWPDRPAIVDEQWAEPVRLTWSEFAGRVRRFAAGLVGLGVRPGDRVAVWAPNSHHWPVAALGTHYAGAVLVPLNTRYTVSEASDIVDRSGARIVVASGVFAGIDRLTEVLASPIAEGRTVIGVPLEEPVTADGAVAWDEFMDVSDEAADATRALADAVTGEDLSDILFTSGTTGAPKGVLAEHRQTIAGSHAWGANGALTEDDRYLMVNPFFHTFGYKAGILPCVLFGTAMLPLAVYSPTEACKLVSKERATVFPGAPTIFQTVLDDPNRGDYDLSSLRLIVTGATIVPVVLIERLQSDLGVETVVTAYGQTETSGFITTCRPDDDAVTVATTCGRAFDGMEVKLSEQGEVLTRGAMVMRGYLDNPEATAETIDADGWLHTGDIGTLDERGNLTITDRLKDMYICGGFNVYPAEVEQTLSRVPGVTEVAVIGVPDERLGEVGKAFVTTLPDTTVTVDDVLAHAREHLANFKVPRTVEFVDAFPRNASGKILKREMT
ncbi:3-[(3aS,4S,7aS)-7a-methyl-1,5-dioxo-octahydro-1H- inden-4-yl]propanoyl:CoA ligase [Gordonia spumicola]|uniref:3-[(3aS,4S,7aS)-7a-methyl-1,5-dioxo-octahydro-1H-inden-4-yl]propanoyl:CoA ligase n=1 Tax=Gordonia spumicola TaxID=589161 RepID=A0A7I9V4P4_9ACTN|nr:FadD3 family acyl-CoA ligase [Gordonia spumicola]GED99980.1 3-[(3aS,4S,7aS)-7a-methyl-1,5-dioxo-octahydro-1H- inden-4-yl]propanoyl:CoA ligase [Gordonia spumicola]